MDRGQLFWASSEWTVLMTRVNFSCRLPVAAESGAKGLTEEFAGE